MRRLTLLLALLCMALPAAALAGDEKEDVPPGDGPSPVDEGEVDMSTHPDPATMAKAYDAWWAAQKSDSNKDGSISFTDPVTKEAVYLTLVKWEKDIFLVQGEPGYCRTGKFRTVGGEEGEVYRVDVWVNPDGQGGWNAANFEIQAAPTQEGSAWKSTTRKTTLTSKKHWSLE